MAIQTHTIRRCFMTGRQCTFCKPNKEGATGTTDPEQQKKLFIFMARPFRDNLATSHSWSLKPYLKGKFKELHNIDAEDDIELYNADDLTRIGAITCEKICRPIQMADYLVADVSVANPNVMYELGLALGLGKRIILIANNHEEASASKTYASELSIYISGERKVLPYNGVRPPSPSKRFHEYIINHRSPKKYGTRFIALAIKGESSKNDTQKGDIHLEFDGVLEAAIGVALKKAVGGDDDQNDANRKKIIDRDDVNKKKVREIFKKITYKEELTGPELPCIDPVTQDVKVEGYAGEGKSRNDYRYTAQLGTTISGEFDRISKNIDEAFCCVIDLAGETPLSYLWLGYCHARGINVIPVYRKGNVSETNELIRPYNIEKSPTPQEEASLTSKIDVVLSKLNAMTHEQHILAFDIRALWYIDYEKIKPEKLAELLSNVFAELIIRDLPRRQKDRFWDKLACFREIHIYTGAIHNPFYGRETVGDWDQRTVSELVGYLASADSTVRPMLEPPCNMPKLQGLTGDERIKKIAEYHKKVKELLQGKDCIILASADVNSLTEILLAYAYLSDKEEIINSAIFPEKPMSPGNEYPGLDIRHTVVAHKTYTTVQQNNPNEYRLFSREAIEAMPEKETSPEEKQEKKYRGFVVGRKQLQTLYSSMKDSRLLSHFMLMRNPFPNSGNNYIVILNGVSGPGTYALAEILTGGSTVEDQGKNLDSEKMLEKINEELTKIEAEKKSSAVQGIVAVEIKEKLSDKSHVDIYDQRKIEKWSWCMPNAKDKSNAEIVPQDSNPWTF